MNRFLNICLPLAIAGTASAITLPPLSIYEKIKSNTFGTWASESGFSTVFKTRGNLSLAGNIAIVYNLPLKSSTPTLFTSGLTLRYKFGTSDDTFAPTIYTKLKHDLFHTFAQETGFSGTLYHQGPWTLGVNAAVVYNYPIYIHDRAPGYTVGLTLTRKL